MVWCLQGWRRHWGVFTEEHRAALGKDASSENCQKHPSSSHVTWPVLCPFLLKAMFELVTSEASYYKSLELLETHFLKNPVLVNTLGQTDMHFLFSNIEEVMKASER